MGDITCDEFAAAVQDGLTGMVREWREGAVASPEDFPQRMSFEAWRLHFCWTVMADLEEPADLPEHLPGARAA